MPSPSFTKKCSFGNHISSIISPFLPPTPLFLALPLPPFIPPTFTILTFISKRNQDKSPSKGTFCVVQDSPSHTHSFRKSLNYKVKSVRLRVALIYKGIKIGLVSIQLSMHEMTFLLGDVSLRPTTPFFLFQT